MAKNQNVTPHQKSATQYPGGKNQGPQIKTSSSKSKKMDRPMDDGDGEYIRPTHRNQLVNNDEDADDIVERENNFDEDIQDEPEDTSEEETNDDL